MSDDKLDDSNKCPFHHPLPTNLEERVTHLEGSNDIRNTYHPNPGRISASHYPVEALRVSVEIINNAIVQVFDQCIADLYSNPSAKWKEVLAVYLFNKTEVFTDLFSEEDKSRVLLNLNPYQFFFHIRHSLAGDDTKQSLKMLSKIGFSFEWLQPGMIPIIREFGLFTAVSRAIDGTSLLRGMQFSKDCYYNEVKRLFTNVVSDDSFVKSYLVAGEPAKVKCLAMTISQKLVLIIQLNRYLKKYSKPMILLSDVRSLPRDEIEGLFLSKFEV